MVYSTLFIGSFLVINDHSWVWLGVRVAPPFMDNPNTHCWLRIFVECGFQYPLQKGLVPGSSSRQAVDSAVSRPCPLSQSESLETEVKRWDIV